MHCAHSFCTAVQLTDMLPEVDRQCGEVLTDRSRGGKRDRRRAEKVD